MLNGSDHPEMWVFLKLGHNLHVWYIFEGCNHDMTGRPSSHTHSGKDKSIKNNCDMQLFKKSTFSGKLLLEPKI